MKNLIFLLSLLVLWSCSSELIDDIGKTTETHLTTNLSHFSFNYQGNRYESQCFEDTLTGQLSILDSKIAHLYDSLLNNETTAILFNDLSEMYIYDNNEDRDNAISIVNKASSLTKSSYVYIHDMKIKIYDKEKGRKKKGDYITIFTIEDPNRTVVPNDLNIPNMGSIFSQPFYNFPQGMKFDNRMSSFEIWGTFFPMPLVVAQNGVDHVSVTFYDGYNYTGKSVTFTDIFPGKTYSRRDYMKGFQFDNIASSMKIRYHRYGK